MHFIEAASPEKGSFLRSSTSTLTLIWLRSKGHIHHGARLVRWLIIHQFQDAEDHQGQVKNVPDGGSGWSCASKPTALANKGPRRAEVQKEWSIDSYLNGRKDIEIMKYLSTSPSMCLDEVYVYMCSAISKRFVCSKTCILHGPTWNMACDFNVCANSYTYKLSTNN